MVLKGYSSSATFDIYLGRAIGTVGSVSDEQFNVFLTEFSEKFPSFTCQEVLGYWQGKPERTSKLTVICLKYRAAEVAEMLRVQAIIYSARFYQEAVLINHYESADTYQSSDPPVT